jgi:hypothetical protein
MTAKTDRRNMAIEKRCANCEISKFVGQLKGPYGIVHNQYKCCFWSERGTNVYNNDLRYWCPMGKKLEL